MTTATLVAPETPELQTQTTGDPPMSEHAPVEQSTAPSEPADQQAAQVIPTKGLSLWQPWASLIAIGAKHIETRSWPTGYRGPIAILATKDLKPDGVSAIDNNISIGKALSEGGVTKENIPLGGIVAVADLVDCFQFTEGFDPGEPEKHFGDFTPGRCGFKLENIRALPSLLPCSGAQKIFELMPETIAALAKVMAIPVSWAMPGALQEVPELQWDHFENEKSWEADSLRKNSHGDGQKCYHIDDDGSNRFKVSFSEDIEETGDDAFKYTGFTADSLESAKAWCAAREAELFNASCKPVEAESAPAAEEKVGSKTGHGDIEKHVNQIEAAERYVTAREEEWEDAKQAASEAKKAFDDAVEKLRKIIRWNSEPAPLFDKPASTAGKPTQIMTENMQGVASLPEQSSIPADDDTWKSVTLEALGIKSSRALKALHEHNPPITTHGELSAWQTAKGDFWAKDIKGIGVESRKEIEDAQLAYWNAHPRTTAPATDKQQEQKADGPAPLVWYENKNADGVTLGWYANNTAGIVEADGIPAYYIDLTERVFCFDTLTDSIFDGNLPPPFPSLEAAQQWCQQQNDAAWARLRVKPEADGQLQPSATDGEKVQASTSTPILLSDLGLTEDAVRAAYYPNLLKDSRGDKCATISGTFIVNGRPLENEGPDQKWIAVEPRPRTSCDYFLVPIYADKLHPNIGLECGVYCGIQVELADGGQKYWLAGDDASIQAFVKPPSTVKDLPRPEAQAEADVANFAKQAGVAAIDADKAKRSKRGKKETATV